MNSGFYKVVHASGTDISGKFPNLAADGNGGIAIIFENNEDGDSDSEDDTKAPC